MLIKMIMIMMMMMMVMMMMTIAVNQSIFKRFCDVLFGKFFAR